MLCPSFVAVPGEPVLLCTSRGKYPAILQAATTVCIDGKLETRYFVSVVKEAAPLQVSEEHLQPVTVRESRAVSLDLIYLEYFGKAFETMPYRQLMARKRLIMEMLADPEFWGEEICQLARTLRQTIEDIQISRMPQPPTFPLLQGFPFTLRSVIPFHGI